MVWENGDGLDPEEEEDINMAVMTAPGQQIQAQFPALAQTNTNNTTSSQKTPKEPPDPNIANPRLLVNRGCIYERHLPGNAYITAHVQRLQHGYYASPAVSDCDFDFVDFLAIYFVFHSPNTLAHRFKAATIRASVRGSSRSSSSSRDINSSPSFLMHAPHLIYGAVSPETLQWNFSLAGSLGIADMPVSASLNPSGGMNGRYKRYEMMRIQGSARTWKSPLGPKHDIESGEVVWSLEENSLQRSGLPREFSFPMLIQKPRADSKVVFDLEIEPIVQSWYGSYPTFWLSLPAYKPVRRRPVDFRRQIGQRFKPVSSKRGYNFAALESCFDDYVHMPGRKHTSFIPPETGIPRDDFEFNRPFQGNYPQGDRQGNYPRDYTQVEPINQINNPTNPNQPFYPGSANTQPTSTVPIITSTNQQQPQNINLHVLLDTTHTTTTPIIPYTYPLTKTTTEPPNLLSGRRRSLRQNRSSEQISTRTAYTTNHPKRRNSSNSKKGRISEDRDRDRYW